MENYTFFTETIVKAFKKLNIPLGLPKFNPLTGTAEQLQAQLKTLKPDVILTNGWTQFHQERYLKVIKDYCRDHKAFYVFWSLEDPLHTEIWSKYVIETGSPDFIFTHEYGFDHFYHKWGIPSDYLPLACHPPLHNNKANVSKIYEADISIVGTYKSKISFAPFRTQSLAVLLSPLLKQGIKVRAYGKGWGDYLTQPNGTTSLISKGPIPYEDVPKVYASSKITLGIQNTPQLLTRRTFETMGSGGFLLTMDTPAVRRHFTPQQHLAAAGNERDTLKAVKTFLKNEPLRRSMALKGQQEVYRNHTYEKRIKQMAEIITPYVKAKKVNKTIFVLPKIGEKEIKPFFAVSTNDKNHCRSDTVILSEGQRTRSQCAYMKFHIKKEADYKVTKAVLKLFLSQGAIGNPEVQCFQTLTDWSRESLSKGERPKLTAKPIGSFKVDRPFQTTYPWFNNWYVIDITPTIKQFEKDGCSDLGLCLKILGEGTLQFMGSDPDVKFNRLNYSKRFQPRMDIEFAKTSAVPSTENGRLLVGSSTETDQKAFLS